MKGTGGSGPATAETPVLVVFTSSPAPPALSAIMESAQGWQVLRLHDLGSICGEAERASPRNRAFLVDLGAVVSDRIADDPWGVFLRAYAAGKRQGRGNSALLVWRNSSSPMPPVFASSGHLVDGYVSDAIGLSGALGMLRALRARLLNEP